MSRANIGRGHGFRVLHGREVLPPVVGGDVEETEDNLGRREGGGRREEGEKDNRGWEGEAIYLTEDRHLYSAYRE